MIYMTEKILKYITFTYFTIAIILVESNLTRYFTWTHSVKKEATKCCWRRMQIKHGRENFTAKRSIRSRSRIAVLRRSNYRGYICSRVNREHAQPPAHERICARLRDRGSLTSLTWAVLRRDLALQPNTRLLTAIVNKRLCGVTWFSSRVYRNA